MTRGDASRTLRAFLGSRGVYGRYMPDWCGTWVEGSCLRLAVAVEEWARLSGVQGEFAVVRREGDGVIDHVLYSVGPEGSERLFDGDGVHTPRQVLNRWRMDRPRVLDIGVSRRRAYGADAARPDPSMERLGAELYKRFGPVQEFGR